MDSGLRITKTNLTLGTREKMFPNIFLGLFVMHLVLSEGEKEKERVGKAYRRGEMINCIVVGLSICEWIYYQATNGWSSTLNKGVNVP